MDSRVAGTILAGLAVGAAVALVAAITLSAKGRAEPAVELRPIESAPFAYAPRREITAYKYRVHDLATGRTWVSWTSSRDECVLAVDASIQRWLSQRRNDVVASCWDSDGNEIAASAVIETGELLILSPDGRVQKFTPDIVKTWRLRA